MSLGSQVDFLYYELELFEKKVRDAKIYNPKYQAEINRLKFQSHQLHSDALTVDTLVQTSRVRPEHQVTEIKKRTFLLSHEIGYLKESFSSFARFDRNPPVSSELFSSPSDSGSPESRSPIRHNSASQSSGSNSLSQSSTSSQSSQGSSSSGGSYSSYNSNYSSPGRNISMNTPVFYAPQPVAPRQYVQHPFNFTQRRNYYY